MKTSDTSYEVKYIGNEFEDNHDVDEEIFLQESALMLQKSSEALNQTEDYPEAQTETTAGESIDDIENYLCDVNPDCNKDSDEQSYSSGIIDVYNDRIPIDSVEQIDDKITEYAKCKKHTRPLNNTEKEREKTKDSRS